MLTPSIWTSIYSNFPPENALRRLHTLGWSAFEMSTEHLVGIDSGGSPFAAIERINQTCAELGLVIHQAHGLLGANVADPDLDKRRDHIECLRRHIGISARLGARVIVIHPGRLPVATVSERKRMIDLNVEAFHQLGDWAGEKGMRIGLEDLQARGMATAAEMYDILDAIAHPAMGFTLDTSHANALGLDTAAIARDFGPHLIATHISDNNGSGDQHLTPGGGTIKWPTVMQALREGGYTEGYLNLENPGERHEDLALRSLKIEHARKVVSWLLEME